MSQWASVYLNERKIKKDHWAEGMSRTELTFLNRNWNDSELQSGCLQLPSLITTTFMNDNIMYKQNRTVKQETPLWNSKHCDEVVRILGIVKFRRSKILSIGITTAPITVNTTIIFLIPNPAQHNTAVIDLMLFFFSFYNRSKNPPTRVNLPIQTRRFLGHTEGEND